MSRKRWYKLWEKSHGFNIENDRLKHKCFIYSSPTRINQYGYQSGNLKSEIISDTISRYARINDLNVLNPTLFDNLCKSSFDETRKTSQTLDDHLNEVYLEQLMRLGIGINQNKCINFRDNSFLSSLQLFFIELYEKKYILYKNKKLKYDEYEEKLYDLLDDDSDNEVIKKKVFVLKIDNLIPNIIQDIKLLNINEEIKEELISYFCPDKKFVFNLELDNKEYLTFEMKNPSLLGGVTHLLLNPNYMDVKSFIDSNEINSFNEFLNDDDQMTYFSGSYVINPLTGKKIPVFISKIIKAPSYAAIPFLNEDDLAFANENGLEVNNILDEDGRLIDSDILSGLDIFHADEKIKSLFLENGLAKEELYYKRSEINLYSQDTFGALFPFLYDKDKNEINSLKNFLPFKFSSLWRPIIGEDVDVKGVEIKGTISSNLIYGISPFISIIYDSFSSGDSIFTDLFKEEIFNWAPIKDFIVNKSNIINELLMPIIIYNIIKKELGYSLPNLFNSIILVEDIVDIKRELISRKNNNLINMEEVLNKYYSDALRMFYLKEDNNQPFIFNIYELNDIQAFVKQLQDSLNNMDLSSYDDMDYFFHSYLDEIKYYLDNRLFKEYVNKIITFSKENVIGKNLTKKNLKTFLISIYPIMPFLAEEIYENKFDNRYSIMNETWPI